MSEKRNVGNSSGDASTPHEENTALPTTRVSVCSVKTAPVPDSLPSATSGNSSGPVTPQPPRSAPTKSSPATARHRPRHVSHTRMPAVQSARTANNSPTARTPSTEPSRSPSATRLPGVRSVPTPALRSTGRRASLSPSQDTLRDAAQALRNTMTTGNARETSTSTSASSLRHTRHRAHVVPPHPIPSTTLHAGHTRLPTDRSTIVEPLHKPLAALERDVTSEAAMKHDVNGNGAVVQQGTETARKSEEDSTVETTHTVVTQQPDSTTTTGIHAHSQEPETRKKKHVAFGAPVKSDAPHSTPSPALMTKTTSTIPGPPSFDETQAQHVSIGEADSSASAFGHLGGGSHSHEMDEDGFGSISMAPWERKMHEIMRAGSIITGLTGSGLDNAMLNPLLQPHSHPTTTTSVASTNNKPPQHYSSSNNVNSHGVSSRVGRSVTPPHSPGEAEVKYPPDSPPSREVNEETFLELSATPGLGLSLYQSLQRSREQASGLPLSPNAATGGNNNNNSHSPTHRSPNTVSVPSRSHRTTPAISRVSSSQTPLYACTTHYPTPPPPPPPQPFTHDGQTWTQRAVGMQNEGISEEQHPVASNEPRPSMLGISLTPSAGFFHAMPRPMQSGESITTIHQGGTMMTGPQAVAATSNNDPTTQHGETGNGNTNNELLVSGGGATCPAASSVPMATVNAADALFAQRQQLQRNSFAFAGVAAAYQAMHNNNTSFTNLSFLRDPLNLSMATDALNVNRPALIAELQRRREKLKRHLAQLQHEATERNIFAIVRTSNASQLQYLLQARLCNVNERDYNQCTPLHVAASEGDLTMVRVLVSFNADLYAVDRFGRTPLDCAASNRHGSVGRFLIAALRNQQVGMAAEGSATNTKDHLLHAQGTATATTAKDSESPKAHRTGSPSPLLKPPAKDDPTHPPDTANNTPPQGTLQEANVISGTGHETTQSLGNSSSTTTTTTLPSTSHTACGTESHIPVVLPPPYLAGGGSPTQSPTPSSEQPTPLYTHAHTAFQSTASSANTTTMNNHMRPTASTLTPINGAAPSTVAVHTTASRLPTPPHFATTNSNSHAGAAPVMPAPQRSRLYDVNGSFIDMVNVTGLVDSHGTRLPPLLTRHTAASASTSTSATTPAAISRGPYSASGGGPASHTTPPRVASAHNNGVEDDGTAVGGAAYESGTVTKTTAGAGDVTPLPTEEEEEGSMLPALLTSQQFTAATAMTSVHGDIARRTHSAGATYGESDVRHSAAHERQAKGNSEQVATRDTLTAVTASQLDNASYDDLGLQTLDEYRHEAQLQSTMPPHPVRTTTAEGETTEAAAVNEYGERRPSSAAARPLLTPWCATCGHAHSPLVPCVSSAAKRGSPGTIKVDNVKEEEEEAARRPTSALQRVTTEVSSTGSNKQGGVQVSNELKLQDVANKEGTPFEEIEDATTRAAILAEEQEAVELMMTLPTTTTAPVASKKEADEEAGERACEATATAAHEVDNMNASDKNTANELNSSSELQRTRQFYSRHTTISDTVSVIVCMVGLPGRGKSFIGTRLTRYMNWKGVPCRVFNAGQYRRQLLGATATAKADFFNPDNPQGKMLREKMAELACEGLVQFLTTHSVAVGILDATNTTKERRSRLQAYFAREAKERGVAYRLLFIESICTDEAIITENILRSKCENDDFKSVPDVNTVIAEFRDRIQQYEKVYEPLDESEGLSFIKIINVKHHVILHKVHPGLGSRIAFFLLNLHPVAYPIYITLPGETIGDEKNVFGGDERLTARGEAYARALKQFIQDRYVPNMVIFHATNNSVLRTLRPLLEDDGAANTTATPTSTTTTNSPCGTGLSPEDAAASQPLGSNTSRGPQGLPGQQQPLHNHHSGAVSSASHAGSPVTTQLGSGAATWSTAAVYSKYAVGGYAGRKEAMPIEIGRHHHHHHHHHPHHHHNNNNSESSIHSHHHNHRRHASKESAARRQGSSTTQSSAMDSHPQSNTSAHPAMPAGANGSHGQAASPNASAASPTRRMKSYTFPVSQSNAHGLQLDTQDTTTTNMVGVTNETAKATPDVEDSVRSGSEASSASSKSDHNNHASSDDNTDDSAESDEDEVVDEVLCPVPGLDNINYGRFSGHSAAWIKERYPRLSALLYDNTATTSLSPALTTTNNNNNNTSASGSSDVAASGSNPATAAAAATCSDAQGDTNGAKSETTSALAPIHLRIKDAAKYFQHDASGVDPHLAYCVQFPNGESCRQVNVRLEPALMAIMRTQSPVFVVAPAVPAQGILSFFADVIPELSTTVRLPRHCVVEIGVKEDITIHPLLVDSVVPPGSTTTTPQSSPVGPTSEAEAQNKPGSAVRA